MACGTTLVKYVLFLFNFLFVIGGIGLIAVGALTYTEQTKYVEMADLAKYQGPPIAMMVFGSVMFVIAFMGCCGAIRESNCMIMTYSILLFLMLVIEIGIAVAVIYYKDDFSQVIRKGFQDSIREYENDPGVQEAWDSAQQGLKCCGANDYRDWGSVKFGPIVVGSVPDSCCVSQSTGCGRGQATLPTNIFTTGCVDKALEKLQSDKIVYAGVILAGVELIGIIFACCLGARFRNKSYRNNYI